VLYTTGLPVSHSSQQSTEPANAIFLGRTLSRTLIYVCVTCPASDAKLRKTTDDDEREDAERGSRDRQD
jgi:hypothetical protein